MASVSFDDIISEAGGFGRYQKYIHVFIIFMFSVPSCWHNLGIVFLAAVPDHWCQSPSADHLNLSRTDRLNLTVPREVEEGVEVFSRCRKYVRNYTGWTDAQALDAIALGSGDAAETSTCTEGWEYDKSVYRSSIVTQWDLVCERSMLGATAASVYMAGLMVGVLLFGSISDRFGRRVAIRTGVILLVVLPLALPFSPNYVVYICLRFVVALANMGTGLVVYVAGLELVSPEWRLLISVVPGYYWAASYMLLAGLAYAIRDWFYLQTAISGLGIIAILPAIFMPESPRWLYSQGRHEEGDRLLRKIARINERNLPASFHVHVKKDPKHSYVWDLMMKASLRGRSLILFFCWFVVSMVYYGLALNTGSLTGDAYVNASVSAALEFPAILLTHIMLRFLGRRALLSAGFVISGISLVAILAVPKDMTTTTVSLAMTGKFFNTGVFTTIYIFSAEQFPTVVRNVGLGASSFWARIGAIIAPYIGTLISVSRTIPYVTFGVLSVAAGLLILLLPETKGRNLIETITEGEDMHRKAAPECVAKEKL